MVESYLRDRPELRLVLLLVDSRIPPTPDDVLMKQWLDHYDLEYLVVLTKADKLSRSQLNRSIETARGVLETDDVIPFSAITGLGRDRIMARIQSTISPVPPVSPVKEARSR